MSVKPPSSLNPHLVKMVQEANQEDFVDNTKHPTGQPIWPTDADLDITGISKAQENKEFGEDTWLLEKMTQAFGRFRANQKTFILVVGALYKRNDTKIPEWAKSGAMYSITAEDTTIPYNYAFKPGDVVMVTSLPEPEKPWQNVLVLHNNARTRLYVTEDISVFWDLVSDPNFSDE